MFGCEDKDVFTGYQLKDITYKYSSFEDINNALQSLVESGKKIELASEGTGSATMASEDANFDLNSDDELDEFLEEPVPTPSYDLN